MSGRDGGMRKDPVPRAKVSDPLALSLSLADIAARSQRVIVDFLMRSPNWGKEGQALRTETTINDTRDFAIGRRIENLQELRKRAC
jgi:hypothetical protein